MFICRVVPLFLTSKILCAGGFQITLFGRSGKEWFFSFELASNSCLEQSGSQLPEQKSPVSLVLLKHAKPNLSMFDDRDACRRALRAHLENWLYFQICVWILCSLSLSLSLSLPPSISIFLFSSEYSLPLSLSLSLSFSLFSLLSSLSLSLSLSILPFSSLSSSYSRSWLTSSQSRWTLWIFFTLFSVSHPTYPC